MMEIRNLLVKEYPLKYMIEYPSIHLPEFKNFIGNTYDVPYRVYKAYTLYIPYGLPFSL